jgi:hypothetical protein
MIARRRALGTAAAALGRPAAADPRPTRQVGIVAPCAPSGFTGIAAAHRRRLDHTTGRAAPP